MRSREKAKVQLIEDLTELQDRLVALTNSDAAEGADGGNAPHSERSLSQTSIHFIGDFGLVEGKRLDLADGSYWL